MCFLPHRISAVLHGARLENFVVADSNFTHRCTRFTVLTEILRTNDLNFEIYATCTHFGVGLFLFRDLVLVSVQKKKIFFWSSQKKLSSWLSMKCVWWFFVPHHPHKKSATHNTTATVNFSVNLWRRCPPLLFESTHTLSPSHTFHPNRTPYSIRSKDSSRLVWKWRALPHCWNWFSFRHHVSQSAGNARISSSTDFKLWWRT